MTPVRQTYTTTGAKPFVNLDWCKIPFNVSATVVLVDDATATFGVEYTTDDIFAADNDPDNFTWIPTATGQLPTGSTATGTAVIDFPVTAVRINIADISGTVQFTVVQGIGV